MTPDKLKNVGTVVGIAIFVVPLAAIYISIDGWEPEPNPRGANRPAWIAPTGNKTKTNTTTTTKPQTNNTTSGPTKAGAQKTPTGPVTVGLKLVSPNRIEVVLRNNTDKKLRIAVPEKPGGLIAIWSRGKPLAEAKGPVFDEDTDDVVPIQAGASYQIFFDIKDGFQVGPLKVVYDSTGDGVPKKAWKGRAESNTVRVWRSRSVAPKPE